MRVHATHCIFLSSPVERAWLSGKRRSCTKTRSNRKNMRSFSPECIHYCYVNNQVHICHQPHTIIVLLVFGNVVKVTIIYVYVHVCARVFKQCKSTDSWVRILPMKVVDREIGVKCFPAVYATLHLVLCCSLSLQGATLDKGLIWSLA